MKKLIKILKWSLYNICKWFIILEVGLCFPLLFILYFTYTEKTIGLFLIIFSIFSLIIIMAWGDEFE